MISNIASKFACVFQFTNLFGGFLVVFKTEIGWFQVAGMPKEEIELDPPPPKGQKSAKKNRIVGRGRGIGGLPLVPGAGMARGRPPSSASPATLPAPNSTVAPPLTAPHLPSPIPGSTATTTVPTTHATHNSLPQQVTQTHSIFLEWS